MIFVIHPSLLGLTGQSTGNPAATDRELAFWQTAMMRRPGKCLIPVRMIPWEEDFTHIAADVLFSSNYLALAWMKGEPMPENLVEQIATTIHTKRVEGLVNLT